MGPQSTHNALVYLGSSQAPQCLFQFMLLCNKTLKTHWQKTIFNSQIYNLGSSLLHLGTRAAQLTIG